MTTERITPADLAAIRERHPSIEQEPMICDVTGTATVRRVVEGGVERIEWMQADEYVHVSAELAANPSDALTAKYELGDWCPVINAYHARRIDDGLLTDAAWDEVSGPKPKEVGR